MNNIRIYWIFSVTERIFIIRIWICQYSFMNEYGKTTQIYQNFAKICSNNAVTREEYYKNGWYLSKPCIKIIPHSVVLLMNARGFLDVVKKWKMSYIRIYSIFEYEPEWIWNIRIFKKWSFIGHPRCKWSTNNLLLIYWTLNLKA